MTAAAHCAPDCPFTLCYEGDGYSTARRMMGRHAAGQALMKAIAQAWPKGLVRGLGTSKDQAHVMFEQLRSHGFDGELKWSTLPDWQTAREAGTVYYPEPLNPAWAAARNLDDPAAFSFMGVTHTVASQGSMDLLAGLVLPPFQPWDAVICTSAAAKTFVSQLHDDMRAYWRDHMGATRFVDVELPVIPLGVDVAAFTPQADAQAAARHTLGLQADETVFLFAGRLAFQAKANPVATYQALEMVAREQPVVCIEAGIAPNPGIQQAYAQAQKALAPSVRFIHIDGQDPARYRKAWHGADVFISLADNIQETFGLTPLEAMAAGLPVVVSDWSGYRDTVRDGIDGLRIPTALPPAGMGGDLALRHALHQDSYDFYIGRTSLATVVEPLALQAAFRRLAADAPLRRTMGAAGQARARSEFDWPVILRRYAELTAHLNQIRQRARAAPSRPWPQRADPFRRFGHFASRTVSGEWRVRARPDAQARLRVLLSLTVAGYAFDAKVPAREALLSVLEHGAAHTVDSALAAAGQATPIGVRALMWLWKFDLVEVTP